MSSLVFGCCSLRTLNFVFKRSCRKTSMKKQLKLRKSSGTLKPVSNTLREANGTWMLVWRPQKMEATSKNSTLMACIWQKTDAAHAQTSCWIWFPIMLSAVRRTAECVWNFAETNFTLGSLYIYQLYNRALPRAGWISRAFRNLPHIREKKKHIFILDWKAVFVDKMASKNGRRCQGPEKKYL